MCAHMHTYTYIYRSHSLWMLPHYDIFIIHLPIYALWISDSANLCSPPSALQTLSLSDMYVYTYVCMYTYTYMYVYIHIYIHTCMHTSGVYICMCTYVYLMYICIFKSPTLTTYAVLRVCVVVRVCVTCIHTCVCVCMYTCVCVCVCVCV